MRECCIQNIKKKSFQISNDLKLLEFLFKKYLTLVFLNFLVLDLTERFSG